jgi:alkylhydroperoxidase family enzyme
VRLEPIDRAPTLLGKFISLLYRLALGKTIMPARVVYNRVPRMYNVGWALLNLDLRGFTLPQELLYLMHTRISTINGCQFCKDIVLAGAVRAKLGREKFGALMSEDWKRSPLFTDRERAAIAFAEETTADKKVSDATFAEVRRHFDDREIAELAVEIGKSNFYNMVNVALDIEDDGLLAIAEARQKRKG